MRLYRDTLLALGLAFALLVAHFFSGDWLPWVDAVFGVLTFLLALTVYPFVVFGKNWWAPERWFAIVLGLGAISTIWSTNYYASIRTWSYWALGFVLFASARALEQKYYTRLAAWFAILASGGAVWALIDQVRRHADRAEGLLKNANALGGLLVLAVPIVLYFALHTTGWRRWVSWLGTIVTGGALAASFSLTALWGLFVGVVVYVLYNRNQRQTWTWVGRGVLALVAVAVLVMGLRSVQLKSIAQGVRLDRVITAAHFSSSFSQRWNFDRTAIAMVKSYVLQGVGLGAYQQNYPRYALTVHEQPRYAHNAFLELAAEAGVITGFAFVVGIVGVGVGFFRRRKQHMHSLVPWLSFAVLASAVNATVDFGWHFPFVWCAFWIFAGFSAGPYQEQQRTWGLTLGRALVVLVGFGLVVRGALVAFSEPALQRGERLLTNGNAESAIENFTKGLQWDPNPIYMRQLAEALWVTAGGDSTILESAAHYAAQAATWAKTDYFAHRLVGRIAFSQRNMSAADSAFQKALMYDQAFHPDITFEYANFLMQQKRPADARRVIQETLQAYHDDAWSSNPTVSRDLGELRAFLQTIPE